MGRFCTERARLFRADDFPKFPSAEEQSTCLSGALAAVARLACRLCVLKIMAAI